MDPLRDFWTESFLDVNESIIMKDNAPVHKGVCIQTRKNLGMITLKHPPNSPDLNQFRESKTTCNSIDTNVIDNAMYFLLTQLFRTSCSRLRNFDTAFFDIFNRRFRNMSNIDDISQ